MQSTAKSFRSWIEALPRWHGWLQVSAERPYAHAEEAYDDQYGVEAATPEEGEGLCRLLRTHGVDTTGPALEVGCGTGVLTHGLAKHYPGSDFLITDPSAAFLRITQSQFKNRPASRPDLHFAVLNADDLGLLPAEMFSLIAMRSTLHHILRPDVFITASAERLRPNGALVMGAEPVESGYLLMGVVGQLISPVLQNAGVKLLPKWNTQLKNFTDTIQFYCQRDLNKSTAEDKHLFRVHELAELGRQHGLQLRFFPNASLSDYVEPFQPDFENFSGFFFDYLKYCMLFDLEFLELIRRHLEPQLKYINECHRSHIGPAMTGVFLLKKTAA